MMRPLAPSTPVAWTPSAKLRVPTSSDWAALYPEMEKLYVRERKKLRHVIQHLESKHGYKTTPQMCKKRFAKWGFQKNSKRSTTSGMNSSAAIKKRPSQSRNSGLMITSPGLTGEDTLLFIFLTNVQTWSTSFYESVQSKDADPFRRTWPERSHEMNSTFKLAIDVLNRGHGSIAGRVARKAFLLAEEMLMFDSPVLLWNLLEMMHYLVTLNHVQVLKLLLLHIMAMVDVRMEKNHPLPTILRALRSFIARSSKSTFTSNTFLAGDFPPSSLLNGEKEAPEKEPWTFSGSFLSMIKRAWTLNAEILFRRFDHRLFQLYIRIHWESCSIAPPTAIISTAQEWLAQMTEQRLSSKTATKANKTKDFIRIIPFEEDNVFQRFFTSPAKLSPPQCYDLLHDSSIIALQDHATSILSKNSYTADDTSLLLRVLAALVTTKILDEWPASGADAEMASTISRGSAGIVASAIRTSMDFASEHNAGEPPLVTVMRIKSILSLREYANVGFDPRVIRELWRLEDALVLAGEVGKAGEVKRMAYRRVVEYVEDIPAKFV